MKLGGLPLIAQAGEQEECKRRFEGAFRGALVAYLSGYGDVPGIEAALRSELSRWLVEPAHRIEVLFTQNVDDAGMTIRARVSWPKGEYYANAGMATTFWEGLDLEIAHKLSYLDVVRLKQPRSALIGETKAKALAASKVIVPPPPAPDTNEAFALKMRQKRESDAR